MHYNIIFRYIRHDFIWKMKNDLWRQNISLLLIHFIKFCKISTMRDKRKKYKL